METLFANLLAGHLKDVLVSGYLENRKPMVFKPLYDRLYFDFGNEVYEVESHLHWTIAARRTNAITPWFEIDEDDLFAVSSVYKNIFLSEQQVQIDSIHAYTEPGTSNCMSFCVAYSIGQYTRSIFFNPKNTFGFSISESKTEEASWLIEASQSGISLIKNHYPSQQP